jgi:ribosome-binding ATPase YchF (GTP1/OBG family)
LGRSGKTTIFNALTQRTGESAPAGGQLVPVLGVVSVPDPRVDWLSALYNPKKTTYAQVTYMDLQGMPGAADNKREYMSLLLNHMRPMDAFLVVIRNFDDSVLGAPDPGRDFQDLEDEFVIADLATVEKNCLWKPKEARRSLKGRCSSWKVAPQC